MPTPHAVLLVDADPKGLESLVYGFQGAEWRMTACPSPETASLLVKASGAQIVVVASRAEPDKTHSLIRQLRGKEAYRALPILVLGPEELRQPLKENAEVDLLGLPAFVRDVLTSSELLVTAGASSAQKPGEEPAYQSATTSAKTLSLVRSMNGLARSGHLHLERKGRAGEIMFHQGELTSASIGPLQGMAAAQHLMIWNDGKLELRLRQVQRRGQMNQTAQEFLQELDRFQRDFAHGMKEIGPATTTYSADQERLKKAGGAVPAEVTPVVRLCNGNRSLADIIDESPFRVLDTVRILGRLAELGILIRADGKPVVVTAPGPRDEFLETARITASTTAWPMPAPIAAPPAQASILRTPAPPTQATKEQTRAPAAKLAEGEARQRKRTLEIGIPVAAENTQHLAPAPTAAPAAELASPPSGPVAPQSPFPLASANSGVVVQVAQKAPAQTSGSFTTKPSPVPAAENPPGSLMQAGGVIKSSNGERRSQPNMPAAGERRSVVIEAIPAENVKTPLPLPAAPRVRASVPSPSPEAAPTMSTSAPVTGVLHVAPSRRTAAQVIPTIRPSIQLDVSLSEPHPTGSPAPAPIVGKSEPAGTRVTGEMHVAPSGRNTRGMDKAAPKASSFQIDPSLAGGSGKTPGPVRVGSQPVAAQKRADSRPIMGKSDSRPIPLGRSDSRPIPGSKTRPSGNFSTVETDFFDREADLYKEEKAESFADLDDGKAKGKGKPGAKGKPGRPYRK